MRRVQGTRRTVATASANEGVRLDVYQGRVFQVGRVSWQARYKSQTALWVHRERAAARSGPLLAQHWGSSAPQELLDVAIGFFDRPKAGVGAGHRLRRHGQVGAEEEVVRLLAVEVADDHEQERPIGADRVPDDRQGPEQTPYPLTANVGEDVGPLFGRDRPRDLLEPGQPLPLLARTTALSRTPFGGRVEEGGVLGIREIRWVRGSTRPATLA